MPVLPTSGERRPRQRVLDCDPVGADGLQVVQELAEEDRLVVGRARRIQRFLSQPFFVAEQFTGTQGRYVKLADTIRGFKEIVAGKYDHLPEQAFYMVGGIEEAVEKGAKLAAA